MASRSQGIKKSNFTAQTSIPADASFDYVSGSSNYKITYTNLLTSLGVSGTLQQEGSGTALPILDDQGTVKGIRGLEVGNGLEASVSGTNGISIASGITQDTVGLPILQDIATSTPNAVSLSSGTGIEFNTSNGNITITATGATADTKRVTIRVASDFPTPVADVITLADDTEYFLDGAIDIGNDRFVMGTNCIIKGYATSISSITSTTTGDLFTLSSGQTVRLADFAVTAASARIFNGVGGGFEDLFLYQFTINSCTTVGAFSNWYSFFWEKGAAVSFTSPLSFSGACTICIFDFVSCITGYTTAVDLGTATFNNLTISRCAFNYASATNHVIVAANGANVNSGFKGRLLYNNFNVGATNIVTNFASGDVLWDSIGNLNLPSTARDLHAYMQTPTTTTISGGSGDAGNPIIINGGTSWVTDRDQQFTSTTGGRFTYNGTEDTGFLISAGISGTAASASAEFAFYIAKNGTIITGSKTSRDFNSGSPGSPTPSIIITTLATGDYVELFIENLDNTQNFDTELLNFTITEV